jgi:hypothetical protein
MTPDASFTMTAVSQREKDAMNGNVRRTALGLVLGAALIAATASDLAAAGARLPRSTEGTCTYRGVIFPNGVTTTFDCPLNPLACYSNAAMLPSWTCRNGRWCNQSGACYAKPFGG